MLMFRLQQERTSRNVVIRLGSRRDMVAAIWEGITLIPDSKLPWRINGQIKITAVMLHAIKILRSKLGFISSKCSIA